MKAKNNDFIDELINDLEKVKRLRLNNNEIIFIKFADSPNEQPLDRKF